MKKNTLIQILFAIAISFQLIFYHLPEEIRFPLFLLSILLITILWLQKNSLLIPKTFAILYFFYLLANFYSGFYSPDKFQATLQIIKLINIFCLVILGVNIFQNKKAFLNTSFILPLIGSFWALCGILEFTGRVKPEKVLSLFEPFHWPTLSASFFLLIFPLALILFLNEKKGGVKKIILFASLFFITVAWILSRSYLTIFLLITFALLVFFFYVTTKQPGGNRIIKYKSREILLFLLLIGVVIPNLLPSFGGRQIPKEIALFQDKIFFQDKNDVWRFSTQSIKDHFWQGIGPGNFGLVYRQNIIKPWTWSDFASNELLHAFVETGLLGFTAQLLIFLYLGFVCFKQIGSSLISKNLPVFAISLSTILFLFINLNNFSFQIFPITITFFTLVASLLTQEKKVTLKPKFASFLILPLIFFAFWIFSDSNLLRIGQKSIVKKNYPKSEKILNWLSRRPTLFLNPRVFVWFSAWHLDNHQPQKAIEYLKKAKIINPYNQEIDYQIAAIIYRQERIGDAKKILEEKLESNPFLPPKYYSSLAKLNLEMDDEPTALLWLKKASNLFPILPTTSSSQVKLSILENNKYLASLWEIYFYLYGLTHDTTYLEVLNNLNY